VKEEWNVYDDDPEEAKLHILTKKYIIIIIIFSLPSVGMLKSKFRFERKEKRYLLKHFNK
jgi:hypothetical protein